MDIELDRPDDVDNWTELMLIYTSALKQIETKLEILNEEFQYVSGISPACQYHRAMGIGGRDENGGTNSDNRSRKPDRTARVRGL